MGLDSNILGVFVINRENGLCLFSKICNGTSTVESTNKSDEDKYSIFSGLISAVSNIVTHVADDYIKTMKLVGEDRIKIVIETGSRIAVAIVADKETADRRVYGLAKNLVKQFNYFYGDLLKEWKGDLSKFQIFNKVVENEIGNKNLDFTDFL